MFNQTTYQILIKTISKIILINLGLPLLFLFSSCDSYKGEIQKSLPVLTSEQQVKDAVTKAEKKSDDPRTWPKINKLIVIENYALVRYIYKTKFNSEMLLVQKNNRWFKVFGADTISLNTITKMKVPSKIAKKLLEKI
jgi:hypothetical protein